MNFLAVIPARYGSTRFPGKPLASVAGVPMIQRVYQRVVASGACDKVVVATDDERIARAVQDFGGQVVMTSDDCPNGTMRCHEAVEVLEAEARRLGPCSTSKATSRLCTPTRSSSWPTCSASPMPPW